MNKPEIMAALFAVLANTDKAISELGDKDKRAAFEAEVEALAEQIGMKEEKIAQQALEISQGKAKLTLSESTGKTALDKAAQGAVEHESKATALATELAKFGATPEERTAMLAEHATLQEFYKERKGSVAPKGDDVTGVKTKTETGEKNSKTEKEARVAELKEQFPRSIGALLS